MNYSSQYSWRRATAKVTRYPDGCYCVEESRSFKAKSPMRQSAYWAGLNKTWLSTKPVGRWQLRLLVAGAPTKRLFCFGLRVEAFSSQRTKRSKSFGNMEQ